MNEIYCNLTIYNGLNSTTAIMFLKNISSLNVSSTTLKQFSQISHSRDSNSVNNISCFGCFVVLLSNKGPSLFD